MAKFVGAVRAGSGYVDLDEEDAFLDIKAMFKRKGVDAAAGDVGLQHLLVDAKDFFESFGDTQEEAVRDVAEEKGVILCDVAGEKEDGEPDESDEEFSFIVSLSKQGKVGTLHRRGGCWRAARFAFGSYEWLVDLPAEPPTWWVSGCGMPPTWWVS